jgi:hypothetical protein
MVKRIKVLTTHQITQIQAQVAKFQNKDHHPHQEENNLIMKLHPHLHQEEDNLIVNLHPHLHQEEDNLIMNHHQDEENLIILHQMQITMKF